MTVETNSHAVLRQVAAVNPLAQFDPQKLAHYETVNWVAYYQKRWSTLLRASVGMVREAFALSFAQAVYAAYLVARAEIAAAPFPDNDIPTAEKYMRRFYQYIKDIHKLHYDAEQAARLDVRWWIVHRQLFDVQDKQPLVDAVCDLYEKAFGAEPSSARQAAEHRTRAMIYSDTWIKEGKVSDSPLIAQEEQALFECYAALKRALNSR